MNKRDYEKYENNEINETSLVSLFVQLFSSIS